MRDGKIGPQSSSVASVLTWEKPLGGSVDQGYSECFKSPTNPSLG
jgi:hypothetical protein